MTALLDAGLETEKATMAVSVRSTANTVDLTEADDRPLLADVSQILHLVLDSDLRHLSERSKATTSGMSYILDRLTMRRTTTLASMGMSMIALQEAGS